MAAHDNNPILLKEMRALSMIKETLALSAHILIQDPEQMATQLTGRLADNTTAPIQHLLAGTQKKQTIWLQPLTASLNKVGQARYRTLVGHTGIVNSLAISNDGHLLFSAGGGGDQTARVWDLQSGSEVSLFQTSSYISSLALTPDNAYLLLGLGDGSILVVNWRTQQVLTRLAGHTKTVNAIGCEHNSPFIVSASADGTLIIWNLNDFKKHRLLKGHSGPVNDVVISPQGNLAVSASADHTLRVWDIKHGRKRGVIQSKWSQYSLAISPDGRTLVSGSEMVPIIWDLETMTEKVILTSYYGPYHEISVDAVAITPDGRNIISAGNLIHVWDMNAKYPYTGNLTTWTTETGATDVVITPDGRWAISSYYDHTIKVWNLGDPENETVKTSDTATGDPIKWIGFDKNNEVINLKVKYHRDEFGEDSEWLSTLDLPENYPDWNYRTRDIVQSQDKGILWIAVGNYIETVDVNTGKATHDGSFGIWTKLAVSPNGNLIAGFNWTKNKLEAFDTSSGKTVLTVDHIEDVESLAITADDRWIVTGFQQGDIQCWHLPDQKLTHFSEAHTSPVNVLRAVSVNEIISCAGDGFIRFWNLETGSLRHSIELPWKSSHDLKVSADRRWLAVISIQGDVLIFDQSSRNICKEFPAGSVKVSGVWNTDMSGHPLSNLVLLEQRGWVALSNGEEIIIWDLINDCKVTSFIGDSQFETFAVSPDESFLVIGTVLGELHKLKIETPEEQINLIQKKFNNLDDIL